MVWIPPIYGDLGDGLSMLIIVLTTLPPGYVKIAIEHDHL